MSGSLESLRILAGQPWFWGFLDLTLPYWICNTQFYRIWHRYLAICIETFEITISVFNFLLEKSLFQGMLGILCILEILSWSQICAKDKLVCIEFFFFSFCFGLKFGLNWRHKKPWSNECLHRIIEEWWL